MTLRIDYVEFHSADLAGSKTMLTRAFGWSFTDYGRDYSSFADAEAGINGGFAGQASGALQPALIVLKADDLAEAEAAVVAAGGEIVTPAFAFPGGRRFHFREPGGNVLAVWSEK